MQPATPIHSTMIFHFIVIVLVLSQNHGKCVYHNILNLFVVYFVQSCLPSSDIFTFFFEALCRSIEPIHFSTKRGDRCWVLPYNEGCYFLKTTIWIKKYLTHFGMTIISVLKTIIIFIGIRLTGIFMIVVSGSIVPSQLGFAKIGPMPWLMGHSPHICICPSEGLFAPLNRFKSNKLSCYSSRF